MSSSSLSVTLSHHGFKNLYGLNIDNDFTFSCGVKKYSVPRIVALFFSPTVANLMKQDPLLDIFEINDIDDQFHYFYELMQGDSPDFPDSSLDVLLDIANQLGNQEIITMIMDKLPNQTLSTFTICDTIRRKKKLNVDLSKEFQFLYQNLASIDVKQIAQLGIDTLSEFFSGGQPNFDFDSYPKHVFSIVMECIYMYSSEKAACLFQYIPFIYLESNDILEFLLLITPDQISPTIWDSLSKRLIDHRQKAPEFKSDDTNSDFTFGFQTTTLKPTKITITPKQTINQNWVPNMDPITPPNGDQFGGVFSIYRSQNKNPIKEGFITISCSGTIDSSKLEGLLQPNNPDYWSSFDSEFTSSSPSLTIEFNLNKIKLEAYTLRTINYDPPNYHISSWVVEVSNNDQVYELVDEHTNSDVMNSRGKIATFAVKPVVPYKFVRFRMTGPNCWNTKQMCLSSIELFGQLS